MPTLDRQRSLLRQWYIQNGDQSKERLNAEYQNNPEVRAVKIERAREYRKRRKAGQKVQRVYYRVIDGHEVEVYSMGYVAEQAGTYAQMLSNFEKRGWIPKPTIKEHHRLYTLGQAQRLIQVVNLYNSLTKFTNREERNKGMLENRKLIDIGW